MRILLLLTLLATIVSCSTTRNAKLYQGNESYIPNDINEAIHYLDTSISNDEKEHITNVTMQSFLDDNYMILGKWIRNNWGFWTNSDLYKQLQKEYKVETPDAASILVLEKFYQHLLDKKN